MSKYSGIVAAIIVIVAAVFLLGWAATHRLSRRGEEPDRTEHAPGDTSQGHYMREVRLRHQEDLAAVTYGKHALVGILVGVLRM